MLHNLKILFSSGTRQIAYILLVILFSGIWWYATDINIMFGNYGKIHTSTDIGLSIFMIILFPVLIIAIIYKSWKYGKRADIELNTINGVISGLVGTIISGASCCGATLATYFGLLPLMSFLPYDGLELKILGAIGLAYGLYSSINHLNVCKIK